MGRNAALAAGFPETVVGTTIDRQCGSSQQAAHFAAQGVMAGANDIVIAAGVEVMTRVPMGASVMSGPGLPFGSKLNDRYASVGGLVPQGISAELIADKWNLSREELDAFSVQSHLRAARATEEGRFEKEIIPVTGADGGVFDRDEGVRPDSNVEKLATLKPAFKPDGKVTAGNSSQISDGAAALLIMSEEKANELGLRAPGPVPHLRPGRRRPGDDADRPHPGHREGAGAGQDDARPTSTSSRSTRRSPPWCWRGRRSTTPT